MERQRSNSLTSSNNGGPNNVFDNAAVDSSNTGGGSDNIAALAGLRFPSDAYNNNGSAKQGS